MNGCRTMGRSGDPRGPTATAGLYVALLGHARLWVDGKPFEFAAPRKTLPILAYLLVHRAAAVSRDFLAFTMWPDADEEVARGNLRRNLTLFKSVLPPLDSGAGWISATNEFVRWNPAAPCTLDVAEFDRQCGAESTLGDAIDLYAGDLLEDLYDDWVFGERERLRAAYLTALKTLVERHRSDRDFQRALGYAQRLLAADPLREDVAREIAAIRYQAGDRAGALHGIDAFIERLRTEPGIEAMPETCVLRDAIMRGTPANVPSRPPPSLGAPERIRPARADFPFVGRETPLERAAFFWDRAARGSGSVTFVGGEAGIGKTRFVGELASRAEDQGGRVLIGTTTGPESYAYQAFVEALRSAGPLIVASNLEPIWLGALAAVVPELAARVTDGLPQPLRPDEDKTRLFESIARALHAIARARPLLVVLEDMHWCGTATAELLRFVSNRIGSERIAIVATVRTEDVGRSHPLRAVRRELEARGSNVTIELSRLDRSAVARIVDGLAQHAGSRIAGRAAELYDSSLGNPLFLGELIGAILESADEGLAGGATPTIASTIVARLGRLDDAARRAVDVAAVAGDTFDFELIGEITGWQGGALLDALDVLIERNVLRETTRRERGAYAFTHHLIRSAAYGAVPPERRRRYHGIAARAIGALYEAQADEWASELARHYEGSDEPLAAARAWSRAARRALRAYANEEAVRDATRGIGHLTGDPATEPQTYAELLLARIDANDRLGNRERQRDDIDALATFARARADSELLRRALGREIDLALTVGETTRAVGAIAALAAEIEPAALGWQAELQKAKARLAAYRYEYETALCAGAAAIEMYRGCGDAAGEFETLLVMIETRMRTNRYDENRPDLDRAAQLARTADDPLMKARLMQAAILEPFNKQDFSTGYRLAGELLELSRATGNRHAEARALERRAFAANRKFALGEALDGYAKALEIYESIGDRRGMLVVENNWATLLDGAFGKVARCRERLQRVLAASEAAGELRSSYFALSNLGVCAYADGDFEGAKAFELRALELARQLDSDGLAALVLGDLGAAERELGNLNAAFAHLEDAIAIHRRIDQRFALQTDLARLALVCATRGEPDRARALAAEIGAYERSHPDFLEDRGEVLWDAARALHLCGDDGGARELAARAAERQAARIAAVDLPEYRESMAGVRWYRALLRARAVNHWPQDAKRGVPSAPDAVATPPC